MEEDISGPSSSHPETSLVVSNASKIPPFTLDQQSGNQMIQKILAKLLAHAGFEGAKIGALNVMTDIMTDYLLNIGKTLRYYWDDCGNSMDGDVSKKLIKKGWRYRYDFLIWFYIGNAGSCTL
jgi:transcriptional activator SPT7